MHVWFLCLMAYQPPLVIQSQIHHYRITVVVPTLNYGAKGVHTLSKGISSKVNLSATEIRTFLLRCRSSARLPQHPEDQRMCVRENSNV